MADLFSIWPEFGFAENPYSNNTLAADEVGDRLLVGRDRSVGQLHAAIGSGGLHPTVEGRTGVGKSSLIAVAGYRMFRRCLDERAGVLFLPAAQFIQMTPDVRQIEQSVYYEIAQALLAHRDAFHSCGLEAPDDRGLSRWLNEPDYHSKSAQGTFLGTGGGVQAGAEPNTADGFLQSGFPQLIREQLQRCFPSPEVGGVICVLDNLELLQTVGEARQTLETLRDRLFTIPGLRWVLCGSRGMVTRARTDRLSGIFAPPMDVGALDDSSSVELIERRIQEYSVVDEYYPPVDPEGFDYLYRAIQHNLRDALAWAQNFSRWLFDTYLLDGGELPHPDERKELLEVWLALEADKAQSGAGAVQPRVWTMFDEMANGSGTAPSSQWREFGFSTQQQMTSGITQLVDANLAEREVDPEDATRRLARLTPTGWLVAFDRRGYLVR